MEMMAASSARLAGPLDSAARKPSEYASFSTCSHSHQWTRC